MIFSASGFKSKLKVSISDGKDFVKFPVPALGSIMQSYWEKSISFKHYWTVFGEV